MSGSMGFYGTDAIDCWGLVENPMGSILNSGRASPRPLLFPAIVACIQYASDIRPIYSSCSAHPMCAQYVPDILLIYNRDNLNILPIYSRYNPDMLLAYSRYAPDKIPISCRYPPDILPIFSRTASDMCPTYT